MVHSDNLTILIVDMVGFTLRTGQLSRSQNRQLLKRFHRLLQPLARRFHGRVVKSMGDSLMIAFRSPTDALHCAMAMHDRCAIHNQAAPEHLRIEIRAALNLGEVRVERNDLFGEPVNIAARLEALTPPNEIWFSEAVYLAMNKAEVPCEPAGEHTLKGIPESVRVYRVPPRTVHRLMPAGDADETSSLPFGGSWLETAELESRDRLQAFSERLRKGLRSPRMRRLWLPAAAATLLLAAGLHWTRSTAPSPEPTAAAPVFSDHDGTAGQAAAASPPADAAARAQARRLLQEGHELYAKRLRGEAIGLYERALGMDPTLAQDPQLAANLVEALGRVTKLAEPLIRQYPSDALLAELGRRSGQAGPWGRGAATRLLRELDRPDLIDHVGTAIVTLQEAETCDARLAAIKRIRQLGDPRGLPAVEAEIDGGFRDWMRNRCLWNYAKDTVRELGRKSAPPQPGS